MSKIATRKENDMLPKLTKTPSAPLPGFNVNVLVGPASKAFIVAVPTPTLTYGATKLTEVAAESLMSGTSALRAGVSLSAVPAAGACISPEPDGARSPAPPGALVLAVPLFGIDALS